MLADVGLIQVDEKNEKLMQFVENAQHPQKYPNIRLKKQSVEWIHNYGQASQQEALS